MASTYSPYQALEYAKQYIKNMPLERVAVRVLDDANKIFWQAAPWRWTVETLTAITVTSNTQDYTLAPPSDFNYLINAYISDGSTIVRHLEVAPSLPASCLVNGNPINISYEGSNLFRLFPNPGTLPASPIRQIIGTYKKTTPNITASNIGTGGVLIFDDAYFPVYEAAVLYYAYLYADDQRAGSVSFENGKVSYSGQKALYEAMVQSLREKEPMPEFNNRVANDKKDTNK